MTPIAQRAEAAASRPKPRPSRASLASKLSVAFFGLVAFVLIVNGALDTYLTYNQAKRAALEVESEKARAAAERVGVFLDEIQTELGWTAGVEWGYAKLEQQRYDFIRLLRQAPAITALNFLDGKGREQLAVSRLEPDTAGSGADFSADPRFLRAVADKVWFGPVEFRRGSEPYMTIALAHVGKTPGVTVADVNLKLVWDVVSAIHVGEKGFAYVVDDKGRLIAHPDLSLVLRDTDFSHLPQVAAALAGRGASEAEVARSLDGAAVLTAHAVAPKTHWTVFVEQPLAEALATAYRSLLRSLALLGLGLTLAAVSGVALARRMAAPIRALQAGAEKLGAGDLAQRLDIRTGDEIEALAGGFNRMAERLQVSHENLEGKVEARTRDLNEALAQQTATAEVLKVISRSAFGLKTVLQTLVNSAVRLCANDGVIYLRDGDVFRAEAAFAADIAGRDSLNRSPRRPGRDSVTGRVALSGRVEQIPDNQADAEFQVAPAQRMNMRALLGVPLLRDGRVEGVFVLAKPDPGLFSDRAVELVRTFADQAVVAIQNVRLFDAVQAKTHDLEESLAQQTATAEVLKVISRSAFNLQGVFDALLSSAVELVGGLGGAIALREGEKLRLHAGTRTNGPRPTDFVGRLIPIDRSSVAGRAACSGRIEYIPDAASDPEFHPLASGAWGQSYLGVPLLRDGRVEGALTIIAARRDAFSARHIELMQTFADQAVIAIENTRLFEEVQARTRDLTEALLQQTATAEILSVISNSVSDAQPVFGKILASCKHLFGGDELDVLLVDDQGQLNIAAYLGDFHDVVAATFPAPLERTPAGRAIAERRVMHWPDLVDGEDVPGVLRKMAKLIGYRSMAFAPMLSDDRGIGAIGVARSTGPFKLKELVMLETFADQAVIAIQNARLFDDTQAALQQQTATADVLKVISRSAFDLQTVLDTLTSSAATLCEAEKACIFLRRGETYHWSSNYGFNPELVAYAETHPFTAGGDSATARVARDGVVVHLADVLADPEYAASEYQRLGNYRTMLGVPLWREGEPIGVFIMTREAVRPFKPRQIELLQTFADQAVIAIENARLFAEVQARTHELEQSLSDLRRTQDRLVQSEKLASLGQLTAGIAHEIKNPLNFVNNFATLSRELLDELRETLQRLPDDARTDADDLIGMIDSNLEKVASHGKRADSIVKNMLLHSRDGSGERARVNINAMVEEALNLGYHGARAEKPGFNVTLKKVFDPAAGEANIYLQEVTRVLLNLISNGFYATAQRKPHEGADFEPTLTATTRDLGHSVEIRIRDNGTGIPDEARTKMFNPFFTTKPAGEGTGLGLSLSHDIVVKQHGGTLDVETLKGAFTEFIVTLPREGAGA